jgi:short-subunit dehydrogenase
MAHSGADKDTQRMAALVARFGRSPEYLAKKVLKAVKANRMRVVIGPDAWLFEIGKRLFPQWIHVPFRVAFAKDAQRK